MKELHIIIKEGDDVVDTLNYVAQLVENGNTSGYNPTWSLVETKE